MILDPGMFWSTFGITGSEPIVQTTYGAAIVGEGVVCALGRRDPLRYTVVFEYMMAYKSVTVLALTPRLWAMEAPPWGGVLLVVAWAGVALTCAWVYPWGWRAAAENAAAES